MAELLSPQLKRLLGYVRPYALSMVGGVLLLALMAVGEGAVILLIAPISANLAAFP